MFFDETIEPVGFQSSWKKERSLASSSAQTREILTDEACIQSIIRQDMETQTVLETESDFFLADIDDSVGYEAFLTRVYPMVSKALERNSRSHAFDGYEVNWDEESLSVLCMHTLSHAVFDEQYQVTGLSWNSTGSVLAAAYGRLDHEDWCTHKSALCLWNLDRRTVNTTHPDTVIDIGSCIMCLEFHPKHPALIAGGTFNGEVVVYDAGREDDSLIASTGLGDDSHREPVSKVTWVPDRDAKGHKYNILSVSNDGKILIWRVNVHQRSIGLMDGYILLTESLPRSLKSRTSRGDQELGVATIAFSHEDPSVFMLGGESGGLYKCSLDSRGTPAGRHVTSSVPLTSPVTFTFDPHNGPVYSVDCSPFHRNLFISCASDASLRIYSMLQTHPLVTLEPGAGYLFSAKWSLVRPMVFAVTTEDGHLLLYDLKHNNVSPAHRLEASPKKSPIYSMQFNANQRQLLATGDGAGYIRVWQLSDDLTTQHSREVDQLAELAEGTAE